MYEKLKKYDEDTVEVFATNLQIMLDDCKDHEDLGYRCPMSVLSRFRWYSKMGKWCFICASFMDLENNPIRGNFMPLCPCSAWPFASKAGLYELAYKRIKEYWDERKANVKEDR